MILIQPTFLHPSTASLLRPIACCYRVLNCNIGTLYMKLWYCGSTNSSDLLPVFFLRCFFEGGACSSEDSESLLLGHDFFSTCWVLGHSLLTKGGILLVNILPFEQIHLFLRIYMYSNINKLICLQLASTHMSLPHPAILAKWCGPLSDIFTEHMAPTHCPVIRLTWGHHYLSRYH